MSYERFLVPPTATNSRGWFRNVSVSFGLIWEKSTLLIATKTNYREGVILRSHVQTSIAIPDAKGCSSLEYFTKQTISGHNNFECITAPSKNKKGSTINVLTVVIKIKNSFPRSTFITKICQYSSLYLYPPYSLTLLSHVRGIIGEKKPSLVPSMEPHNGSFYRKNIALFFANETPR